MEISDFVEETAKMEAYYEKEYTQEQRKIMFEELKYIPRDRYKVIISKCIRSRKFLPKLADILEIDSEIPRQVKKEETVECKHCNGTGIIVYIREVKEIDREYKCVARCSCQNGVNISKKVPRIEMIGM